MAKPVALRAKRTRQESVHSFQQNLQRAAAAAIEPLERRVMLSSTPSWLDPNSAATWDSSSHVLTVTGSATIVANPGADDPQVTVSGSSAALTIEPGADKVIQLGSLTLSNGGLAEVTRPDGGTFDPSSSLVLAVGTAGETNPVLSIDSTDGSTLGLEDNHLLVHQGMSSESNYILGLGVQSAGMNNSDALDPTAYAQDAMPIAGSDAAEQLSVAGQSLPVDSGDVLISYDDVGNASQQPASDYSAPGPAVPMGMFGESFAADYSSDDLSSPISGTTPAEVSSVVVNGNIPSLSGPQRSMVDSIQYTFSEPVTLNSSTAFSIAVTSGQTGTVPTLSWSAVSPDGSGASTQWVVSFSGNGVVGNSIADGVYDITLNTSAVTSEANPTVPAQPHNTDTFFRLFGDINGDGVVNAGDNFQFKKALTTYNAAFDYNDDGVIDSTDTNAFNARLSTGFTGLISFNPAALEPTDISAVANSPTSVTISWTAPANAVVSGYRIQYWSVAQSAWEPLIQNLPADSTTCTATALPDTAYEYEVATEASGRVSDWSGSSNDVVTPLAPLQLVASGTDASSVSLNWGAVDGAQSYNIYRQGPADNAPVLYDSVDASNPSYTDTFADSDTAYSYQVTAVISSGESSPSNAVMARTLSDPAAGYDTLWTYGTSPQNSGGFDASAIGGAELGVQFTSDVSGYASGIQFYKGAEEGGIHTGELWDASGNLLASATFADESQSGWQQVDFTTPVLINAGQTYTASYFNTSGYFPSDTNYFAASSVDAAPLHAASGTNGVLVYGPSAFPSNVSQSSNYWVQPVFFAQSAAPSDLVATPVSASEIDLSWDNTVPGATEIDVQRGLYGGGFTTISSLDPTALSYPDQQGLAENTEYQYQLIYVTPNGNATSVAAYAYTLPAVDGLTAVAASDSEIDLSWESNAHDAEGFVVEESIDGGGTWTALPPVSAGATIDPVTGLTADQDYTFEVCAIRPGGNSQFAGPADAYTLPSAPSSLTASANGTNEIDLSWPEDDPNVYGYDLQRSDDGGNTFSTIADLDPGTTSYTDTDVLDGTMYQYQLLVDNASGESDASAIASATTDLAAPSGLVATSLQGSGVQLAWVNNSQTATSFIAESSTDGRNFGTVALDSNSIDSGTTPGQTYYYQVAAFNANTNVTSAFSPPVSVTALVGTIEAKDDTPVPYVSLPVASGQSLTFSTTNLLLNDVDPNNGQLSIQSFTQPSHGALVDNGDGTLTYTATLGYNGTDSFTYTATDQYGASSNAATVQIPVTYTPPEAGDETVGCASGDSVTGSLLGASATAPPLGGTTNPDLTPLTFTIQQQPQYGSLSLNGGQFTYTAPTNFSGVDTFTYVANDGVQNSNVASVNVIVEPGIVTFSGAIDGSDYLHIQGDKFWIVHRHYYAAGTYPGLPDHNLYVDGVIGDAGTTWTISPTLGNATSVVALSDGRGQVTVTQQPSAANGYETVVLLDDDPEYGPAWYDVEVMPTSPPPPTLLHATSLQVQTVENQTFSTPSFYFGNLLSLNSGANPPAGLAVAQVTDGNPAASGRQLTLNSNGNFSYTPPPNFIGTDWFTYKMTDSAGDASTYGTVFIDVMPVTPDTLSLTVGDASDPFQSGVPQDTPFVPIDDGYDSDSQTVPNDQLAAPDASDPFLVPGSFLAKAGGIGYVTSTLNFPSNVRIFQNYGGTLASVTSGQTSAPTNVGYGPLLMVEGLQAGSATISVTMTPVTFGGIAPLLTQPITEAVTVQVGPKPLEVLSVNNNTPGAVLTPAQQQAGVFVPISTPGPKNVGGTLYQLPIIIHDLQYKARLQVPTDWIVVNSAGVPQPTGGGGLLLNPTPTSDVKYFVEATSNGIVGGAAPQITLTEVSNNTLKSAPNYIIGSSGQFSVTAFQFSGATDVPQFGTYEYNVTSVKGGQWLATGSGINPQPIKNNASDVDIPWGGGPSVDQAVYQSDAQYIWDLAVNIFKITVNPGPNGAAYGGQVVQIPQTAKGSAPGLITVTTTTFNMDASVTVQGPSGTAGMQHLTVGFVQNLAPVTTKGEYANAGGRQGAEVGSTLLNGRTIDMGNPPTAAFWDTQNTSRTTMYSDEAAAKTTGSQLLKQQTNEIKTLDAPKVSMPRSWSRFGGIDKLEALWNLSMYVVVGTNEAPSVYVPEAYLPWTFNGTGNVDGNIWTGNGSGITFRTQSGQAQWVALQGAAAGGEPPFNTGGHQFNSLIQNAAENGAQTIVLNKSTFP